MGLLDEIIDGASSDGVTTTNLLRKVRTVAHRVGADVLSTWAKSELDGYSSDDTLPGYRGPFSANVVGQWSGPFNTGGPGAISSVGVPENMQVLFSLEFRQGLAEIEQLASHSSELAQPWDPYAVGRYNELIDQNRVPHIEGMGLVSANRMVTPALLRSIVESVRTRALDLALDLQSADPSAGEAGGPTRENPEIDRALTVNVTNIYGDGTNIAQGTGITQTSTVTKGDLGGLVGALEKLIADREAIRDAVAIITSDADEPQKRTKLQKVGDAIAAGTVNLTSGVTSNVAAAGLMELAGQYLGW